MQLTECFAILYYQGEVAASACSGHLPGQHLFHDAVLVDDGLYTGFLTGLAVNDRGDHCGKHGYLGIEGVLIGLSKGFEVTLQDGLPAYCPFSLWGLYLSGNFPLTINRQTTSLKTSIGKPRFFIFARLFSNRLVVFTV